MIESDLRILLIDDSGMARTMIANQLRSVGIHDVTAARNGADAVDKLKLKGAPDLIICDWNMPTMNGYDFLVWLRQSEFASTPLFMATAQGDKKPMAQAMDAGANGVLPKPFSTLELRRMIDEVLGGGQRGSVPGRRTLSYADDGRLRLKIVHAGAIDHLALGVLEHLIAQGAMTPERFELVPTYMESWNAIQDAIEHEHADAGFVLPPMGLDLYGFGVPLKCVLLGGRGGGNFVRNRLWSGVKWSSAKEFFMYKVVCIPHKMSLENMLAHKYLVQEGLRPGVPGTERINVRFEVIPPVKMPQFMAMHDNVAGFMTADPIPSMAVVAEIAEPLVRTAELWEHHPASTLVFREEVVDEAPEAVQEFVNLLIEAGGWIMDHPSEAARVAISFLHAGQGMPLAEPVLRSVLTDTHGISFADLSPSADELDAIQRYMYEQMDIGDITDLEGYVDASFAMDAYSL